MRTAIYARYSSTLQNSRSIEDQIAVCRQRAEREGWTIVGIYPDYAISGAAGIEESQRPGLNALMAAVERGGIDQVLAESTDRIARHQGDSFAIRERLEYARCRLFTLSDGQVDEITGTIKGLMDARFRKELAAKIKRGQQGTVGQGRSPAGLAYGYRKANRLDSNGDLVRGLREIDAEQAAIVQRIFAEFAAGSSARTIAQRLNAQGVPAPGGATWRTTTIYGDSVRQNGILQNRLYAGVLVHNRTSKITDPRTRKVRIRPNPESEWIIQPVAELRIIDDDLWHRATIERHRHQGAKPEQHRRPKHLLSGLAFCGVCGGGWTAKGNGYWGCGRFKDGGGCANNRTVKVATMESRVLHGLQEKLLDPELISAFVAEYHREFARRSRDAMQEQARIDRKLRDAAGKMDRLVAAIASGAGEFSEVRQALADARATRDAVAAEREELTALPVVTLHPRIADDYRKQVASLNETLANDEASRAQVLPILRSLIDRITVMPASTGRGVDIEVSGRIASMLALATGLPVPGPQSPITATAERVKGIEPSS